jgi:hypothetical protein
MHNPMFPEINNMYDPSVDENVYDYDYSDPNDYDDTSVINGISMVWMIFKDRESERIRVRVIYCLLYHLDHSFLVVLGLGLV